MIEVSAGAAPQKSRCTLVVDRRSQWPPANLLSPLGTLFDKAIVMTDEIDDDALARDIIDVHGSRAATVARDNARAAALAGQGMQARSWIRVLAIIQRRQGRQASPTRISPSLPAEDGSGKE
jgi:hypothetical protein